MEESLSVILLQRIAILSVIAYIFSHTRAFRYLFKEETTLREQFVLMLFFSALSVGGTYMGVPVEGALVNVRDTGVIVGGLLCGPLVGGVAGIIGGFHRIFIGGFTAVECGISTILAGFLAGYIHYRMRPRTPEVVTGMVTSTTVVLFSMGLIWFLAKPDAVAQSLVIQALLPMVLANGLGIAAFMIIIYNAREHQTKIAAIQTHKALHIANSTLPYFRQGLNRLSAEKVATTVRYMTGAAAVAITNQHTVLAHVGLGADHHPAGGPIVTSVTKECIQSGQILTARNGREIGCSNAECPLHSAVLVPLLCREKIVGAFKLYYSRDDAMNQLDIEFAQGLGQIFSTQLELANLQQMSEMATKAELKALQAQVNPHFLFNALNTIVSLCRTDSEQARTLLIELSDFFRRTLKSSREFVSLQEELELVDSYLVLEKARFGPRLKVEKEIDATMLGIQVPAFILQPLVENAVKHGLLARESGGMVGLNIVQRSGHMEICVYDDGLGIEEKVMEKILLLGYGKGTGVGLTNVNERLKVLYGASYALKMESIPGEGTRIYLRIPVHANEREEYHA